MQSRSLLLARSGQIAEGKHLYIFWSCGRVIGDFWHTTSWQDNLWLCVVVCQVIQRGVFVVFHALLIFEDELLIDVVLFYLPVLAVGSPGQALHLLLQWLRKTILGSQLPSFRHHCDGTNVHWALGAISQRLAALGVLGRHLNLPSWR